MINRILKTATILTLLLTVSRSLFGGVDQTRGVNVNSTVKEPISFGPVLDDFNDGGRLNNWGYDTGSFNSAGASCVDSRDSASPQEGLFCLKLVYDVSVSSSFAGYYSKLGGKNLSSYTAITFWVKSTAGGELLKVELKNSSTIIHRSTAAVYVTDFLDGGVTTSWKEVAIPFHNFVNLDGWSNMRELAFVFENPQSVTNGSPTRGTVYIDKIAFSTTTFNNVRIDYFGDKLGTCAMGGNIGDMQPTDPPPQYYTHSFSTAQYVSSPRAMESIYDVNTYDWGGQFIVFGGGTTGWVEVPHNFSDYNYVRIFARAKSATENPKVVKVEIVDGANRACYAVLINMTTSWQQFVIDLNDMVTNQGLDKTTIKKVTLVYEKWRINNAGGNRQGVLYIDNLRFER